MTFPVFVDGEPVLSGARGQDEWQSKIRGQVPRNVAHPDLTFIVSSLRRRGQPFDLDNFVHPLLMVFDEPINYVRARLHVGERPGVLIEDAITDPPRDDFLRSLYLASHSGTSSAGRPGIPEISGDPVFDRHEGIGLSLNFDRSDVPIREGWFGPTEAVIDDLAPWLGHYTSRQLIADHRMRDLRIARGASPSDAGVHIAIWYVPDDAVSVPDNVTEQIATADAHKAR